jgi:hypothetical protein
MKKFALIAASLFVIATLALAKPKRESEMVTVYCKFSDGKTIQMEYSSPHANGRKIFGLASENALVPYGLIWRTGDYEATTFVPDTNITVGGRAVPAGRYTIFTVPNADKWTLIINKKTGEWGIPYQYEADELARVDMRVSKTPAPVEDFDIDFVDQTGSKCTLYMQWENTRASVEITK